MRSARWLALLLLPLLASCGLGVLSSQGDDQAISEDEVTAPALLPANVKLVLPFPAGYRILVRSGYSPANGSVMHNGVTRLAATNDYYALDFQLDGASDFGFRLPVLAPFDGVVAQAGWAGGGWGNYGLRVVLRHDFGDGHVYHTQYTHLDSVDPRLRVGVRVKRGEVLGHLGRSCQRALTCSAFSWAHLHFGIYQDALLEGDYSSPFAGRSTLPEPLEGATGLQRGLVLVSTNVAVGCDEVGCVGPFTCEGRPDGSYCDADRAILCSGGKAVTDIACQRGCQNGHCNCYSGSRGQLLAHGDCVQTSGAGCGRTGCTWWQCNDAVWKCPLPGACNADRLSLYSCSNGPPAAPTVDGGVDAGTADAGLGGCYAPHLGAHVAPGACVQDPGGGCSDGGLCAWSVCQGGGWACASAKDCGGMLYVSPVCQAAPPGGTWADGGCYSQALGHYLREGECLQVPSDSCGSGRCGAWSCQQQAWACATPSECPGRIFGQRACLSR